MLPVTLTSAIERNYSDEAPVAQQSGARIYAQPNGDPLKITVFSDDEDAELLTESTTVGSDEALTSVDGHTLNAYKVSSKPIGVSRELLTDSTYSVADEVVAALFGRVIRKENYLFTNGNGASQPSGFLADATPFPGGSTLDFDVLIDMVFGVPVRFRKLTNVFHMNENTIAFLRKIKTGLSGDKRTIWQENPRAGEPLTLLGYRVDSNNDLPSIASDGTISGDEVSFGDFSKFAIRYDGGGNPYTRVLEDGYGKLDQTGFVVFRRSDSKLLAPEAIVTLATGS